MAYLSLIEEDGVGIVSLNRPPMNALNLQFYEELNLVFDEIMKDKIIKVAVITSALKDMFVAGADTKMIKKIIEGEEIEGYESPIDKPEKIPKIFIAAINGPALGGGLELALGCDFRFIADGPGRVGLPEVTLGIIPGSGGTQRLPRLIGKAKALMMMIKGEILSAQEALEIGLVDKLFPPQELLPKTLEFAKELASQASVAIGLIKRTVYEGMRLDLSEGLKLETAATQEVLKTHDAKEGITAFFQKRKPEFKGR